MESLFNVSKIDENNRIGNLKAEAHSAVKGTKYFPIYNVNGKKMIFKPLSKTKPLTTPLFSYSEVYWSYIINKYFDSNAPRYYLAVSETIEEEQPKYYSQGVLVESLTPNDEKLINLYDYLQDNPDPSCDITDYENYCMMNYDYTKILNSNFIKNNKEIGEGLAYQILLSMLRQDQNFHYENVNFILNSGDFKLAPPIDFEFSTPFLYPDFPRLNEYEKEKYIAGLNIGEKDEDMDSINSFLRNLGLKALGDDVSKLRKNICVIIRNYPNVVLKFIQNLDVLNNEISTIQIDDPDNYIGKLNSDYWEVGYAYFKENDIDKCEELKKKHQLVEIDKDNVFSRISLDILDFSREFSLTLKMYLMAYYNGFEDLEHMTLQDFYSKFDIDVNTVLDDIDIGERKIMIKQKVTN